MAFRSDVKGPANQPRVLGGPVGAQFFEEFFEAGVDLAFRAIPVEIQRQVGTRSHSSVYAQWASFRKSHPSRHPSTARIFWRRGLPTLRHKKKRPRRWGPLGTPV